MMVMNTRHPEDKLLRMMLEAKGVREELRIKYLRSYEDSRGTKFTGELPDHATWEPGMMKESIIEAVSSFHPDRLVEEEHRALCEFLVIGLKGIASYTRQARDLDFTDDGIVTFIHKALSATTDPTLDADRLTALLLEAGEVSLMSMKLLDSANTECYGNPEPTDVTTTVGTRPGILISGSGLRDLEDLLDQTRDSGIDVYTHGEMLPSHAYPAFMGFDHFIGNYGGSRWEQNDDFERFNGPIIIGTSCPLPPKGTFMSRFFTTGTIGYPGVDHIKDRAGGQPKDYMRVIDIARKCDPPLPSRTAHLHVGCAHETLLCNSNSVLKAILLGDIKRFFMFAGCGGRPDDMDYYSELAHKLPDNTMILTAGCAKYRFNSHDFGEIYGIPRLLDAGQCSDSYSLILMLQELTDLIGVDTINELPISFDIALFEQKAVAILLALFHLGVKGIRLGPSLPPFITPPVDELLISRFGILPVTTADADITAMMGGH